jgi:DNA polymerase elongation subunit (family B)
MDHLNKRTDDEFKMPNMQIVSDDEEGIAESIK